LAAIAKDAGARTIAGGCFFGNVAPQVLRTGCIDIVVHGEGEATIVELIAALRTGRDEDLTSVAGISFERDGEVIRTEPRQPMNDLDCLPMPAYDLLPVDRYGRGSRNHPDFAAIELGRGCSFELDLDMAFYIPLTPLPGTPYWKPELWDSTGRRFRSFDFLPMVNGDPAKARLTRELYRCFALAWSPRRIRWLLGGLVSRNARRRRITRRHALRGIRFCLAGPTGAQWLPPWYND
jgi:radical SAM superfamily enzyme YgiQ (UPF0313 family)